MEKINFLEFIKRFVIFTVLFIGVSILISLVLTSCRLEAEEPPAPQPNLFIVYPMEIYADPNSNNTARFQVFEVNGTCFVLGTNNWGASGMQPCNCPKGD
jgi:hypothetical protein